MNKRHEIIASIASVPPLPTASAEVLQLIRDPDIPSTKIAQAIEYDPSLTTNVLRLANSAFFGYPRSVSTVKDALFRLGTNQVFQFVVAATVGKMAQTPVRGYDLSGGDLWDHLIGTAIGSIKIAQALKSGDVKRVVPETVGNALCPAAVRSTPMWVNRRQRLQ